MPESASGSSRGLYSVVCLLERLMPGSQKVKGGRTLLLGYLFSNMVRVGDCHAGVQKIFLFGIALRSFNGY